EAVRRLAAPVLVQSGPYRPFHGPARPSGWLQRVRSTRLYCYHMAPYTFECLDACAGYFVSRVPVVPSRIEVFDDPVAEVLGRGIELRIVPSLWPLRDAVVASSLQFSLIRMCKALPRSAA